MSSVGDVVHYVPGITSHQGENNRDQVVIRGNSSSADFYVNGVRDDVQYYRDLYNLERVEALKGPNAHDVRPRRRWRRHQSRDEAGGLHANRRNGAAGGLVRQQAVQRRPESAVDGDRCVPRQRRCSRIQTASATAWTSSGTASRRP